MTYAPSSGLPMYVVLDTSGSMEKSEHLLNQTLETIYDTIDTTPRSRSSSISPFWRSTASHTSSRR